MDEAQAESLGWWCIHGATILTALHAVHEGQHPDLVYAELYANAEVTDHSKDDD